MGSMEYRGESCQSFPSTKSLIIRFIS